MTSDIVIDTNVLMHANDDRQSMQRQCIFILEKIVNSDISLCVDEGHSICEALNRSKITSEYLNILSSGTFGYNFVVFLAQNKRIKILSAKVSKEIGKIIRKNVRDKTDVCFVKIAFKSREKLFISHDYVAMDLDRRNSIRDSIGVRVVCAAKGAELLCENI